MRPKSIATVVRLLTALAPSVTSRSVPTTATSLMVSIRVVLPAAKGPVTTSFIGRRAAPSTARWRRTSVARDVMESIPSQAFHTVDEPGDEAFGDGVVVLDAHARARTVASLSAGGSVFRLRRR